MAKIGAIIDGKYEILKQIGMGGICTAVEYLADRIQIRLRKPHVKHSFFPGFCRQRRADIRSFSF